MESVEDSLVDMITVAHGPSESMSTEDADKDKLSSSKAPARKRTKTGCLTCRKRRIKCDEAKPTCSNCIKSKRLCEGYTQRLTFKEPMNAYQHAAIFGHHPGYDLHTSEQFHPPPLPQFPHMPLKAPIPAGPLAMIAPKPPSSFEFNMGMPFPPYPRSPDMPEYSENTGVFGPQHQTHQGSFLLSPTSLSPVGTVPHGTYHGPPLAYSAFEDGSFQYTPPNSTDQGVGAESTSYLATPDAEPRQRGSTSSDGVVYWDSDDEASIGESDDEEMLDERVISAHLKSNDLGIQVLQRMPAAMAPIEAQRNIYNGLANDSILATYYPSSTNSPLNDAQTASVFWYFVNVTAPSISLYERHSFDSSPLVRGQPVSKTSQHIWTYTFAIFSFHHPGLLQAILALGSLQIAKLHGVHPTASMKHYHLSLRRLAKNYQNIQKRTQPATLAATLLLSFYEVWNSDHDKWCKHMWGARAIWKDIPMKQMTKRVLAIKQQKRRAMRQQNGIVYPHQEAPDIDMVSTRLLEEISGRPVDYEDFGTIQESRSSQRRFTDADIETHEYLSDLFWWYCKMDVYQSMLGGSKLFMEYELWSQCLPRAPFGRLDAIYGTYDHLMLLLGRMASFAASDLGRKRRARKADPQAPRGPGGPGQSPPMFPGLVPAKANVAFPTGFTPPHDPTSPLSESTDETDIETSTIAALQEWDDIRQAFESFKARLGSDFEPLGADAATPTITPFGPSKVFRAYSIAGIWMNYFMGLIALYRAHPSMPPVAMIAAGLSAKQTMPWALEIGRIAAGLHDDLGSVHAVSKTQAAALIESCLCLFVSAIQFQASPQRYWVIHRLHQIARLTGWQSAVQIAEGCESAWTKAALLGRGAPYDRPVELQLNFPPSVWLNPRRIDRRIQELQGENRIVLAKTERAHYALGLLGMEQDLEQLELRDEIL